MKRYLHLLIEVWLVMALAACAPTNAPTPSTVTPFPQTTTRPAGVRALVMDVGGTRLYKAASDGLFVSGNEGQTWNKIALPNEIADTGVSQVAVRKEQPDTLFIAGEDIGIWRSRDAGKSWSKTTSGLANERVTALAVHSNGYPRDESKGLFVWVAGVGVFESHDDGDSWKRAADAMFGLKDKNITFLTHTPLPESMNTGWLYAATPSGAYLSMDCF